MIPSKISFRFAILAAVLLTPGISALAGEASAPPEKAKEKEEPFKRPPYNNMLRFKENWSGLRGRNRLETGDLFDPIKFIPLNDDGTIYLTLAGTGRLRLESWANFNFVPGLDDTYLLYHVLLSTDLHITKYVRIFAEGIGADSTTRDLPGGNRPIDVNEVDLNQGFLDINLPFTDGVLTLRGGRFELLFGKQRLVSPLPWGNAYRHWDGFSAIVESHGWNVQSFWSEFVPVDKYVFDREDERQKFWGIYATHGKPVDPIGYDFYFLGLNQGNPVTYNGTTGPEDRYTLGYHLFGGLKGFDYDFENAFQFGSVGSGDVWAWMLAADGGYTFKQTWGSPRLGLGFDYASGDHAAGGNVQTFNQLYPLGHAYFGYIDQIGRQNIVDLHPGASLKCASDKLTLKAEGHFFWRAQAADALYNAGGGVVRPGAPGTALKVGSEVDLTANYRFNRHIAAEIGFCHFFAGKFIQQTGPSSDINFFYLQSEFYF